eukprot:CAMPEP_0118923642 /NCGR_PEP_ID=MMETSP1169-20130426/2090_1 /TAXON_ID=36882 /ORGANISM="Pyramimonas obovata, Strain CCMP722" /LENGTH=221 /DNA_ID=CAMNT_0006864657 /DNA_START=350 /DNA_END=1015 /DNA_ORIENTATION=+
MAATPPTSDSLAIFPKDVATKVIKEHIAAVGECDLLKATPAVEEAVNSLVESGKKEEFASESLELGAGVWEVFYMPHIRTIAEPLGVAVKPLRYTIMPNGEITSDVQYDAGSIPLVGRNWLSSGGEVRAKSAADVEITFDSFWVGGAPEGGGPRADPSSGSEADRRPLDGLINSVGKAGFIQDIATFPVLYFSAEDDLCVFKFPPLNSAIAAYRVGPAPPA